MATLLQRALTAGMLGMLPIAQSADLLDDVRFFDTRSGEPVDLGTVTPDTVEGFEILYATPGTGDISEIAGHLLLRIRLRNQPHPHPDQRANPNDLVVSFLADTESGKPEADPAPLVVTEDCRKRNWFNLVNDQTPNDESSFASLWQSLRGLSGGFPVIMDRQTLAVSLKSYTVEQNRDLLRYKLNLTPAQKASLLDHLLHVRDHYEPPYYFFSQNCGSVLVQVVGEGIGDKEVATFHPAVAPPHTLIGNLLRKGIASPVFPSFHSTGKIGFVAREALREELRDWAAREPRWNAQATAELFHADEFRRAAAVDALRVAADTFPSFRPALPRLCLLIQEAERITDHKGKRCEKYTSAATAAARSLHRRLLNESPEFADLSFSLPRELAERYARTEATVWAGRSQHTQHYAWSIGAGWIDTSNHPGATLVAFRGALLRQQMGSPSAIAMQRGSAVELGGLSLLADTDGIRTWELTGLRLHKFRDTLHRVSSVFESSRGWGLGLNVLEVHHSDLAPHTHGSLAGAAALANLISTEAHNDFLYLSAGPSVAWNRNDGRTHWDLEWPVGVHALATWGKTQARASASWTTPTRNESPTRFRTRFGLARPLGEWLGAEHLLAFNVDYLSLSDSDYAPRDQHQLIGLLQWEVHRW